MSSGAVVGTISSTTCEPFLASSAANLSVNAVTWVASSVPVWSMTRPLNAGTGNTPCAWAGTPSHASRPVARIAARHQRCAILRVAPSSGMARRKTPGTSISTGYFLLKSTTGGADICASLATVNPALGW